MIHSLSFYHSMHVYKKNCRYSSAKKTKHVRQYLHDDQILHVTSIGLILTIDIILFHKIKCLMADRFHMLLKLQHLYSPEVDIPILGEKLGTDNDKF